MNRKNQPGVYRRAINNKIIRLLLLLSGAIILSGCAGSSGRIKLTELQLAPLADMPDFAQSASPEAQEAYRFAVAYPQQLEYIPCYCGCNSLGHKNNLECYLKPSGQAVEFDNHAAFCGVCIDITRDVMQLTREGKALADIRNFIDAKYSKSGPSTETEPVPDSVSTFVGPQPETHPDPHQPETNSVSCGAVEAVNSCGKN